MSESASFAEILKLQNLLTFGKMCTKVSGRNKNNNLLPAQCTELLKLNILLMMQMNLKPKIKPKLQPKIQ